VIKLPSSKFKIKIAEVLKNEGFIIDYKIESKESNTYELLINLKYNSGSPVISTIERISKPGRRIFSSAQSLPKINNETIQLLEGQTGSLASIDVKF